MRDQNAFLGSLPRLGSDREQARSYSGFVERLEKPGAFPLLSNSVMKVLRKRRRFLLWELSVLVRVCLQANSPFRTNISLQAGSHGTGICESQNVAVKSCSPKQRNPPACQPGGFRT